MKKMSKTAKLIIALIILAIITNILALMSCFSMVRFNLILTLSLIIVLICNIEEANIYTFKLTEKYQNERNKCIFLLSELNILSKKIANKIKELEEEDLEIYDTDSEDVRIAKFEKRSQITILEELLEDKKCMK